MGDPSSRPRAIVTGGAGFIGGHLVDRLVAEGFAVLVVDDLSTGRPANVAAEARLKRLDIVDADLELLFRQWRPTIVFHLAAQVSVGLSQRDPLRDLAINVIGTHRVASAAVTGGAGRLVFVSSGGAVYGETGRSASERTAPAPTSYYGIHKLAAEGHVRLAPMPGVIVRPSNVYGPRQATGLEGAVVAAFIQQALTRRSLTIDGDGTQTRDFVHVRDVTEALWRLGQPGAPSGIWNVAADRLTTIIELAGIVEQACGHRLTREHGPRRPGDVASSAISAGRLRRLGWNTSIGLPDGITELLRGGA